MRIHHGAKAKLRRDCFIVPKGEVPSEVQGPGWDGHGWTKKNHEKMNFSGGGNNSWTQNWRNSWCSLDLMNQPCGCKICIQSELRTSLQLSQQWHSIVVSTCFLGKKLTDRVISCQKRSNLDCAVVCWTWVRLGSPRHGNRPYVTWSAGINDGRWKISCEGQDMTYLMCLERNILAGRYTFLLIHFVCWEFHWNMLDHQAWSKRRALRPWSLEDVQ